MNKKLFNKLPVVENNMVEALKFSKIEISRFFTKLKELKKELTMCKKIKEQSVTQQLEELLKDLKVRTNRTSLGYMIHVNFINTMLVTFPPPKKYIYKR